MIKYIFRILERSRLKLTFLVAFSLLVTSSCNDFLEIPPPTDELVTSTVFTNDDLAVSAVIGVYSEMIHTTGFASGGQISIPVLGGLSSDEFLSYQPDLDNFQTNSLTPLDGTVKGAMWEPGFKYIYYANSILEGLSNSSGVSDNVKKQVAGEARFIRAFSYFYLVNFFGDLPLILTTDYRINMHAERRTPEIIYDQIVEDLLIAKDLLAADYTQFNNGRIRPTKWAASALLSRVYLYQENWEDAESESSIVINNSTLFSFESDISNVFTLGSPEAIWQLLPMNEGDNTTDAKTFIANSTMPQNVSLRDEFLNEFETGDKRSTEWVGSVVGDDGITRYYPYKYKLVDAPEVNEYSIVLRLTEQYLIRAEAKAKQNKLSEAIADLDLIRSRAELPLIQDTNPSISQEDLLTAIAHERQIELFSEWSHRWFDLKRTGSASSVLAVIKGSDWQNTDVLYPIPQSELDNAPSLNPQNAGY